MKKILFVAICLMIICTGCRKQPTAPKTPKEVYDNRVTVSISQIVGAKDYRFEVTARRTGGKDMSWWMLTNALLNDPSGKPVPSNRFIWLEDPEDDSSLESHYRLFRRDNPLKETLILDTKGLAPGTYTVRPCVRIFENGKDADPSMKDTYYFMHGILPGKITDLKFTIR